jgi:hypothetical protein
VRYATLSVCCFCDCCVCRFLYFIFIHSCRFIAEEVDNWGSQLTKRIDNEDLIAAGFVKTSLVTIGENQTFKEACSTCTNAILSVLILRFATCFSPKWSVACQWLTKTTN